jgi:hypothetical protein
MPAKSQSQRRAAGAELARRKKGIKKQKKATRPFGTASIAKLKEFASKVISTRKRKK